jgi:pimeloyl-ACP methyl ester carboxylesterase
MNTEYLLRMYSERTTLASLAWNPSFDPKLERRLASLKCPTLILWGKNDRLIPPIYGETFHRVIANSQLAMIEGTGHMPMFEKHEEWSKIISTFLSE